MRKDTVQIAMWCLVLFTALSVFVGVAHAQKIADQLYVAYIAANSNANAASNNYNTAVRAATDVSNQLAANKKTLSASTTSLLTSLFSAGALWYVSAPTIVIPVIGSVTPTLDLVNGWLSAGNLTALKAVAEQAASDAHRESVSYAGARDQAYNDYVTQYKKENPTGTPNPPLLDVNHDVYNFECHGGCGNSWDNVEAARDTHHETCALPTASPPGCGKTYYSCTDTSHQVQTCTNFIGWECGISFRECSNSQCSPSGSLWSLRFNHSGRGIRAGTPGGGENICPKCGKSHNG